MQNIFSDRRKAAHRTQCARSVHELVEVNKMVGVVNLAPLVSVVKEAPPVGLVYLAPPVGVGKLTPPIGVVDQARPVGVVNSKTEKKENSWTNHVLNAWNKS